MGKIKAMKLPPNKRIHPTGFASLRSARRR
jgi:hypothetical protein